MDNIVAYTQEKIRTRIMKDTHYFFHSPLLSSVFKNSIVLFGLKQIIIDHVINQKSSQDCINVIEGKLKSLNLYNSDMHMEIEDLLFNLYNHYDAAYNMYMAIYIGSRYFIYQGGIIEDSRDFCVAHDMKILHIGDAKLWSRWKPSRGEYPEGYKLKQQNIKVVPSYLDFHGYDPFIDRGGYNCRHMLSFMSNGLSK